MDPSLKRDIGQVQDWGKFLKEGKKEFYKLYRLPSAKHYCKEDFDFLKTIGVGGFGRVYLTILIKNGQYYAVKVLDKTNVVNGKQITNVMNEKYVLQGLNFPFCVHLEMSFQDNSYLFMSLPFITGGEMFTHLRRMKRFKEPLSLFYSAQVLLAFEYLHYLGIVYRDLKPENILIGINGYIKLADFGFCKIISGRTYTLCGTPEYLAPEVISNKGYSMSVDWWSYGILLYEMTAGFPPFQAPDPLTIYEKVVIGKFRTPLFFSQDLKDLIENVLKVDLTRRFGNLLNGIKDIKEHSWYQGMNWMALFNGTLLPPYVPNVIGPGDDSNFLKFEEVKLEVSTTHLYAKEFEDF